MGFQFVELEAGEEIVFGPMTMTRTTSVSAGGPGQGVSHTSGRTVGITNRRVIVEDLDTPSDTQTIPNGDIQQVSIKRQQRQGQASITLNDVKTVSGRVVKLGLKGLPAQSETLLQETFPGAEIQERKGLTASKVLVIAVILIGLLMLAVCVLPLLAGFFVSLFGG